MPTDPATLSKLDELLAAIRAFDDPRRASEHWKQAYRLLVKTELPAGRVTAVVGTRNPTALAEMIEQLRAPALPPEQGHDPETLRAAMKAFRKRQALTRLDDESKLGHSPLSKGADPRLAAITPPIEWPQSVWQELVRQGRLRYLGQGLYELTQKPD